MVESLQIFEAIELKKVPYMETKEINEGGTIREILFNSDNEQKAYLLVDDDLKRIWTYNSEKCSFRLQIYGNILAHMVSRQLRLFYRVYPLNIYNINDQKFQEILDKSISGGRTKPIGEDDFKSPTYGMNVGPDISVIQAIDVHKAIEYIEDIPKPEDYIRKFLIIGGNVFTDIETTESILAEEKSVRKPLKLGRLNRGFTLFDDAYSLRLIVNNRSVQGLELYVDKNSKPKALDLNIPVFEEERFSNAGNIDVLLNSFQIPDDPIEIVEDQSSNQDQSDDDEDQEI